MNVIKNIGAFVAGYVAFCVTWIFFQPLPIVPAIDIYLCAKIADKQVDRAPVSRFLAIAILALSMLIWYGLQIYSMIRYYPTYGNWIAVVIFIVNFLCILGAACTNLLPVSFNPSNHGGIK